MCGIPNVSKGAVNARIVRTRGEYACLYCGKVIKKGIRAKVYYINGLGREYFHLCHHTEDIILELWELLDEPSA